jgi:serine protease AprX
VKGEITQVLKGLIALAVLALSLVCAHATPAATTDYDPAGDPYSMYGVTTQIGANAWWNAGYTGKGIDVALIDTGVSPVPGLGEAGQVVYGPDLSLESQAPNLRNLDTNGHGTIMAGLIAGRDSTLTAPYASAPASAYRGVAPDARILSIKVATADGGADVSQVIAAIYWVIQHAHDPGLNIRVINLSYGTNSLQSYTLDPLAYAAELAWRKGITVVVAAGNSGFQQQRGAPGLADPAYEPYVIGVGGYDTMGTAATSDDAAGSYSASAGCKSCKRPDFVSVGSHLQGLRVPNGFVDAAHPEGRLGSSYFRISGTSAAAAITTGAVALILQKYPNLTPDQVKRFITANATTMSGTDTAVQGSGELNLRALSAASPGSYTQTFKTSSGAGLLEYARGSDHLTRDGVVLAGEVDIFGHSFSSLSIAAAAANDATWSGGNWNGNSWSGNSWSGNSWSGNSWSGNSWSGNSWSSGYWSGNSWSGNSWSGNSWSGNSWSGNSWSSGAWTGGSWLGATWD